jgi:ATP/maltotriose-dependent transcriptional regulator MalT
VVFIHSEEAPLDRTFTFSVPRVVGLLERALERSVALVVAPAGSGKTTLAWQVAKSVAGARWVPIEEPSLDALALGLASAFDLAGEGALLHASVLDEPWEALARWFAAHAQAPLCIVDDVHRLEPAAVKLLRACIEHASGVARWVLLSREKPALPLSSWMLEGRASKPLDAADLALNAPDVCVSNDLPMEAAHAIVEATGGWAAGVNFALIAMRNGCELRELTFQTHALCFEYFAQTLFSDLDPWLIEPACAAALVDRVDAAYLQAAGFARPTDTLQELCARLGFLRADGRGGWIMHDLVRAYFCRRLESADELQGTIPRRALQALDARGDAAGALRLACRFAPDTVADRLERHGLALLDCGRRTLLADAISAVPEAQRAAPALVALRALLHLAGGAFDRGLPALAKAIDGLTEPLRFAYARRLSLAWISTAQI